MDLRLTRTHFKSTGVYGELFTPEEKYVAVTLEHAYGMLTFRPKLLAGTYVCKRGMHKLKHSKTPFETFEVTNVPGHTGILFHVGNTNADSSGCILLGSVMGVDRIVASRVAFQNFMQLQSGQDSFTLIVE